MSWTGDRLSSFSECDLLVKCFNGLSVEEHVHHVNLHAVRGACDESCGVLLYSMSAGSIWAIVV